MLDSPAAITGTNYASPLRGAYRVHAEVGVTRDGLTSWQKANHTFDFKNGLLRTEVGDDLVTEAGDSILAD